MTLKQRWYRFRYLLSKRIALREKRWQPGVDNLYFLLSYLKLLEGCFDQPIDLRKHTLVSKWRTVDGFLQNLAFASDIIEKQKDVLEPKTLLIHPTQTTLYDFFLTEEKLPLSLKEVSNGLTINLERFLNALKMSQEKDKFRHQYYLRRYFHLIEASHAMTQIVLDLGCQE